MPIPILMPALSPTMEVGTLTKWHVAEGDEISSGDIIAEIETDKATMEVEAVDEGVIGALKIAEGTSDIPVNSIIAILFAEGEDASVEVSLDVSGIEIEPNSAEFAEKEANDVTGLHEEEKISTSCSSSDRIIASPLAKRIALQKNIDLTCMIGTGPNGRIVKSDLEGMAANDANASNSNDATETADAIEGNDAQDLQTPQSPPRGLSAVSSGSEIVTGANSIQPVSDKEIFATYEEGTYELVPLDNMRRTVAERLTIAKSTIPHFYLSLDCELDQLLSARKRLNENAPKEGPSAYKLSVNDFIIKAMALALQYVPDANSTWSTQGILHHKRSDVAVAVSVEGGLYTPIIRHAELKTLSEISNEMKDLAFRARAKKLSPAEYVGGTTSISNLGMFGIKKFDAVINPPHSTILAVGAGERRPVVEGDQIAVRTIMSVTLSCDHRVVDGALGAELLNAFKGFIEDPVTMLV